MTKLPKMSGPCFIEVAFPLPLNQTFSYEVTGDIVPCSASRVSRLEDSTETRNPQPETISTALGCRVRAPFGKKSLVGYVVGVSTQAPTFQTKPIMGWVDTKSFIDQTSLALARWISDTYLCSLGEALACFMPTNLTAPKRARHGEGEYRGKGETAVTPVLRHSDTPVLTLSPDQQSILDRFLIAVDARRYEPFLLRGITDSGKTELYLRVVDAVLTQDCQAIFLLPEIALTPPFIDRLRSRYGADQVGIWHSGLSGGERYRTWQAVRAGVLRVLLGARSAVFAPFPRLGVIIIDEEHEPSYKQEDRPRYHAREVAIKRAEASGAVVIMGSATPSLESYYAAKEGRYSLVELTSRVEMRQLPPVTLIDRRVGVSERGGIGESTHPVTPKRRYSAAFSIFSEPLHLAIEQRLARREQVILFVNRRGFTPFLRCSVCGWVARCPRCSTTLAVHLSNSNVQLVEKGKAGLMPVPADALLRCHACLHTEKVPIQCASCKSMRLRQYGTGTQRVEEEIKKRFPFVKLARLDRDIATSRKVYEKIYHQFAQGELDLLIGTQMVAKGFDFPSVTLVGVVDADVSLHLPDFRAAERTFDLVAQVAGRTGRGEKGGKVLVQTHHPEHYALQAAQQHDYLRFYEEEMRYRQALSYPPFSRLVHVVLRSGKEPVAHEAADVLAEKLQRTVNSRLEAPSSRSEGTPSPEAFSLEPPTASMDILGPAPAPYSRLRGQFRYQIVLKGSSDEALKPALDFLRTYRPGKAFMTVDVDPVDLL